MAKSEKSRLPSASRPGKHPIHWGTAQDVVRFDAQREAAVVKATQTFNLLSNRSYSSQAASFRRRLTPWLLMRYSATDQGARPIPPGNAFWESPDIWVESSDPSGNPVAGKPNFVHARILNLGAFDAVPVRVDFYWGDPSLGLDAAHMHLIGSEYVEVRSQRSVDVRCRNAWIPVFENQGHECLMVNCSNWVADPIINPFQPIVDRHVGQRNLTVIPATPGMLVLAGLRLGNLFAADLNATVAAHLSHLTVEDSLLNSGSLSELVTRVLAFNGTDKKESQIAPTARVYNGPFLEAQFVGHSRFYNLSSATTLAEATEFRAAAASGGTALTLLNSLLHAGEQRKVEVRIGVPESASPGEFIVCRFSQIVQNQTVGGYTVLVRVITS